MLLTKANMKKQEEFLRKAQEFNTPLWIRHVVVPNITDSKEHLENMAKYIAKLKNVQKIELLPYHSMGKEKYDNLGIEYALENTKDFDKAYCKELEAALRKRVEKLKS